MAKRIREILEGVRAVNWKFVVATFAIGLALVTTIAFAIVGPYDWSKSTLVIETIDGYVLEVAPLPSVSTINAPVSSMTVRGAYALEVFGYGTHEGGKVVFDPPLAKTDVIVVAYFKGVVATYKLHIR